MSRENNNKIRDSIKDTRKTWTNATSKRMENAEKIRRAHREQKLADIRTSSGGGGEAVAAGLEKDMCCTLINNLMQQMQAGALTEEETFIKLFFLLGSNPSAAESILHCPGVTYWMFSRTGAAQLVSIKIIDHVILDASNHGVELYTESTPKAFYDTLVQNMIQVVNMGTDINWITVAFDILTVMAANKNKDYAELICDGIQMDRLMVALMHENDAIKASAIVLLRGRFLIKQPEAVATKHFLPILAAGLMTDNEELVTSCADALYALSLVSMELCDSDQVENPHNHLAEMAKSKLLIERLVTLCTHENQLISKFCFKVITDLCYMGNENQMQTLISAGAFVMLKAFATHSDVEIRADTFWALHNLAVCADTRVHDMIINEGVFECGVVAATNQPGSAFVVPQPFSVQDRAIEFVNSMLSTISHNRVRQLLNPRLANCLGSILGWSKARRVVDTIEVVKRILSIEMSFKVNLDTCGFFARLNKIGNETISQSLKLSAGDLFTGNLTAREPEEDEEDEEEEEEE